MVSSHLAIFSFFFLLLFGVMQLFRIGEGNIER